MEEARCESSGRACGRAGVTPMTHLAERSDLVLQQAALFESQLQLVLQLRTLLQQCITTSERDGGGSRVSGCLRRHTTTKVSGRASHRARWCGVTLNVPSAPAGSSSLLAACVSWRAPAPATTSPDNTQHQVRGCVPRRRRVSDRPFSAPQPLPTLHRTPALAS